MTETIKLTLDEIRSEKLDLIKQAKVFLVSLIMVPIAVITHVAVTVYGCVSIPNTVVDIITMSEKTKQAVRKKQNDKKN